MNAQRLAQKLFFLTGILFLSGCMAAQPVHTATPTVTPVPSASFTATPTLTPVSPTATPLGEGVVILKQLYGVYIGGTIYGHGGNAVILAGRGGYRRNEWSMFAITLAGEGYTVLTIGSADDEMTSTNYVKYGIELLRANGFKKIVCIGDSNGASGCALNAHEPELKGLVLLTYHGHADLTDLTYPKIFIAGAVSGYQNTTTNGYNAAADPKTLVIIPDSSDTSPSLLETAGMDLHKQVVDMLKDVLGQ